jgi:hypothetical protein
MNKLLDTIRRCTAAATVIAFTGFGAAPAGAAIMTEGCTNAGVSCSLEELAGGSSFSVGSQSYTNWSFDSAYGLWTDNDLSLSLGSIFVSPLEGLAGLAGFNISGSGFGEPTDEDWVLSFEFNVTSSTPLQTAGMAFPSGDESQISFALSDLAGDGYVETAWGIPGFGFEELAVLVPDLPGLEVFTTLFIGLGELFDVNQLFTSVALASPAGGQGGSVPEPATLLLALAGLAAIGAMRSRRRPVMQRAA